MRRIKFYHLGFDKQIGAAISVAGAMGLSQFWLPLLA
jgi:hypothetical protein